MTKRWGPHIWYLFHGLAEMIHEDAFTKHKEELVNIIKTICQNLPCAHCRIHAKEYTKKITPRHFRNKDHLKQYLFDFHNAVNKKTSKPQFTNFEIYKKINLNQVVTNFKEIFSKATSKISGFNDVIVRRKIINNVITFINKNKKDFTPTK